MPKTDTISKNKNTIHTVSVLLHDIRSVHNVGSIFRTANALGVSKIYISGFTPTPVDRFGVPRNDFAKVSLGAELVAKWEYFDNPKIAITRFRREAKKLGLKPCVIAIEQDEESVRYDKVKISKNQSVLFVLGNEVSGVPKQILRTADIIAEIPMSGTKESLNVGVAFGVAGFRIAGK